MLGGCQPEKENMSKSFLSHVIVSSSPMPGEPSGVDWLITDYVKRKILDAASGFTF